MSHKALKKLEEQLNCPICLDTYTDPKLLPCHHVYCRKCLEKLVKRDQQGKVVINCPNCRQGTHVPTEGVDGLQSAFMINEIQDSVKELRSASQTEKAVAKLGSFCSEHSEKELELYCETCEKLICFLCAFKTGKHADHNKELLSEVIQGYSEEFPELLKEVDEKIAEFSASVERADKIIEEVNAQLEVFENQKCDLIATQGSEARLQYINRQQQATSDQLERIESRKSRALGIVPQITDCRQLLTDCCETNYAGEKIVTLKHAKTLYNSLRPELVGICEEISQVKLLCLLDPLQCCVSGKGLQMAARGLDASVRLDTVSYMGKPYEHSVKVEGELVIKTRLGILATSKQVRVEKTSPSQYEIGYVASRCGSHLLFIRVDDQEIKGSPFKLEVVKTPTEMQGYPIHILTELKGPVGVTVNSQGEVFVCEREGHCISVFSSRGEKLRSFTTQNLRQARVNSLHGVTVDNNGNVLLTVAKANRIYTFTSEGKTCRSPLQLQGPKCIAFNSLSNKVFLADRSNNILVLNPDLSSSEELSGFERYRFMELCDMTCSSSGRVYVADSSNSCIYVFSAEGTLVYSLSLSKHNINFPVSIAVDSLETLYVCDEYSFRISLFTSKGHFITAFGQQGNRPGEFASPRGIAVDTNRTLYVCDATLGRVQAFCCKHVCHQALANWQTSLFLSFFVIILIGLVLNFL